jgi:aminopeptidase N
LCEEHYLGRDTMVAGLKRDITTILNAEKVSPDTPVIHRNLSDMSNVLNRFVYQKGGWVLHMLRARIGTDAFWTGIREYYRRYQNSSASTDDFRRVMEQTSGEDLQGFFTQWLTRPGVPKLEGTWQYDAAAKRVTVALSQTVAGDPFRLPIEIGIVQAPGALPRIEKAELTDRTATFSFASDAEPASVTLDPNTWLLFEAGTFARK